MPREDESVPTSVRSEVYDRDAGCCRVCGRYMELGMRAVHHIQYRSEGGPNTVDNLITIGWLPEHDCHLPVVHRDKRLWQPILQAVVLQPGVTAFAMKRWLDAGAMDPRELGLAEWPLRGRGHRRS